MTRRIGSRAGLLTLGLLLATSGITRAGDPDREHKHKHQRSTVATPHTWEQAGYPQFVSPIAMPSYNDHYSGSYVGGGLAFGGHDRCAIDGTFGWDYTPFRPLSQRIFLGWSHGRHYQGGGGPYRTDGPKPLEHITETVNEHFGRE
jgi:hypothetical protein